jgi:hypothetical protein
VLGDHQAEGRVPDEGQGLVAQQGRMLVGVGGVGERAGREVGIEEAMAQPVLERGEALRREITVDAC